MPKPNKGPRLGAGPDHERQLLANLAGQLFQHEHITTTEAKAKALRPLAEHLITFAKRGDVHARRSKRGRWLVSNARPSSLAAENPERG